ncbi:MAG: glycosyltransferase [Ignavibacteria bacterium]|nr:glycosyltransferase [Ignavibacteria bacterium]
MTDSAKINNPLVAGIVILYNPDESVVTNIYSYHDQIKELVAFDNSDCPDDRIISVIKSLPNVHYYTENRNIGIGYALNYGAHWALRNGYDYLLTMDQDSFTSSDMINIMLNSSESIDKKGIIVPFYENKFNTDKQKQNTVSEIPFARTSGNLLNLSVFEKAGKFKENYFIDYVDLEYCMRLRINGYKIIQVQDAVLYHNEGDLEKKKFIFTDVYPWNYHPRRWFYKIRNLLYLEDEYKQHYPRFFRREKIKYLKQFVKIFFYEKNKLSKITNAIKGYKAYKKNKMETDIENNGQ